MSWLRLSEIASMADGRLIGADTMVKSVTTDSRGLIAGQLFVALSGPRFDGHDFVANAEGAQAAGVIVARQVDCGLPQILVDDTFKALSRLAAAWREQLKLPIVGLTGSNGKTTVKEMIAAILSRKGQVLATRGNLNNHIGVPLTLLAIRRHHAYAVVEMGANHPGEIAALTSIARPDVALITNAAAAHLEGFGSIEGVARAKGEIFEGLRADGIAIINADDAYVDYWRTLIGKRTCLSFGIEQAADVCARDAADVSLHISAPAGKIEIKLPLPGRHNARNALAAAAVAIAVGVDMSSLKTGLESVQQVHGRLVMRKAWQGARLLDDSYNANPDSLAAALEVLAMLPGERWLVLGDMGELGPSGRHLHRQAGKRARASGVTRLYTLGRLSRAAAAAFGAGAQRFDSHTALTMALRGELHAAVSVLVKGSRSMRMEKVVEALVAAETLELPKVGQGHAA
jgi:UDP-N-acetylmuramoyl-tripeptide--D-alanyl-D-alanine ligase